MKARFLLIVCFALFLGFMPTQVKAQYSYGSTGLLHMPTADMQRDKTFMFGVGLLNKNMTPPTWSYNTLNYYLNITIFPWLEVDYDLTLFKDWRGIHPHRFVNQDRQFGARLRLWKEGWWKPWTPQLVVGMSDIGTHTGREGGAGIGKESGNNYFQRLYVAATKHFMFEGIGELGVHAAFIRGRESMNYFNGPAGGVNFRVQTPGEGIGQLLLNGVDLMAEYDGQNVNVGGFYHIWNDHINLIAELHDCKYFSGGIQFKLYLR